MARLEWLPLFRMVRCGHVGIGWSSTRPMRWFQRREFEYWTRWLIGPIYVLRWRRMEAPDVEQ